MQIIIQSIQFPSPAPASADEKKIQAAEKFIFLASAISSCESMPEKYCTALSDARSQCMQSLAIHHNSLTGNDATTVEKAAEVFKQAAVDSPLVENEKLLKLAKNFVSLGTEMVRAFVPANVAGKIHTAADAILRVLTQNAG